MYRPIVVILTFCLLLGSFAAWAQDDGKTTLSEEGLDKILRTEKKPEPKPETAATDTAAEVKETKTFPADERKLFAKITLADGKIVQGRVRNFLEGVPQPDMISEPEWHPSDGPLVQFGTDEFVLDWKEVKTITYDKKFEENGEVSCVEDMDDSPDRRECTMLNRYSITSSSKKAKGTGIVAGTVPFRIVLEGAGGKPGITVDSFLGRIRFTNQRDETRNAGKLAQELKDQKAKNVKAIVLSK